MEGNMIKIKVDGKYYEVSQGKNLLDACLAVGLYIPHFCFHPALGSMGACRLCAVKKYKNEEDKQGHIVMSCMEAVVDGMIVSIKDAEAKAFRATVIEGLMTNHPHDCPVCDEGGECHLQDMTVMTGHNYRRFDFKKRTYNNQELGPFIKHEMNRCIQCYRCVRFYRDYAEGKDLNAFASRNHVYFGRHESGTLENEFSGNLVEVCPTGVFTDKPLSKHFTRKWDLTNAPSVCIHCSVGCNTIVSERYGSIRRIMSRYNGAVNGYFICDRGRFGYEFVNDNKRILKACVLNKNKGIQEEADPKTLHSVIKEALSKDKKILGIGSPRASLESNFALSELVGEENFYQGISKKEQLLTKTILQFMQNCNVISPSLKQMEQADAVLILGEDITNTAPMIALSLRQAVRNKPNKEAMRLGIPLWNDDPVRNLAQDDRSPVFIATPMKDRLDEIAESTFRGSFDDIGCLGFDIVNAIDSSSPHSNSTLKDQQKLIEKISNALQQAQHPLIITGVTSSDERMVHAAINIAMALSSKNANVMFAAILPECNSMGLALIPGKPLNDAIGLANIEEIDTIIILENDLYRRADRESVHKLIEKSKQVIVLDNLMNETTKRADILLPASTFADSEGTLVNNEGRAQRYFKAVITKEDVKESWKWMEELIMIKEGKKENIWQEYEDMVLVMKNKWPQFSKLKTTDADFLMHNVKIPRQTARYSGRTAMHANIAVSETKISVDNDSPLAYSMEGKAEDPPSSMVPFYWTPGWNSAQAMYNYLDEPNGSLKGGDPGIRLIEPAKDSVTSYHAFVPQIIEIKMGEWQIVPVYRIFGSEALSSLGPAIKERIEEPYVYLNKEDMEILGVEENELIKLETGKSTIELKTRNENSMKKGIAGVSVNLPGMEFIDLPAIGKIVKK
jgi:NADH-quinone oxidoreductase subunit G